MDLTDKANVRLQFKAKSLGNESEFSMPYYSFSGIPEFDGSLRSVPEVARLDLTTDPATLEHIPLGSDLGEPRDLACLDGDGTSFIVVRSSRYEAFSFDGPIRRTNSSGTYLTRLEKTGNPGVFVGYCTFGDYSLEPLACQPRWHCEDAICQ